MSGLYQCPNCQNFFMNNDDFDDVMESTLSKPENDVFSAVVECTCGHKFVHGAEKNINENGDLEYWCFGLEYDKNRHKDLEIFPAVELTETTDEENSVAATWHNNKTVHFEVA